MTPGERKGIYRGTEFQSLGCDYQGKNAYPTKAVARVHAARTAKERGIKRTQP